MFGLNDRRKQIDALRTRVEMIVARAPAAAGGLLRSAEALRERIGRLGAGFGFSVRAEQVQALADEVHELSELAALVREIDAGVQRLRAAETALLRDIAQLSADPAVRDWLAERSRGRDRLLAAALEVPDAPAARQMQEDLVRLDKHRRNARALLDKWGEALKKLNTIRAKGVTRELAGALPGLRSELLEGGPDKQGPTSDWVQRLQALLTPLREFQTRDKPPVIADAFLLVQRLDEWIRALDETRVPSAAGLTDAMLKQHRRELEAMTGEYWALSEEWEQHEDDAFHRIMERARALEARLLQLAGSIRGDAIEELERNRDAYTQFGSEAFSPDLAALFARLLDGNPDEPEAFRRWLADCLRANDEFAEALEGDRPGLEEMCKEHLSKTSEALAATRTLRLREDHRARLLELADEVQHANATRWPDATLNELIDALDSLRELARRAASLLADAREREAGVAALWQALRQRAERLLSLAESTRVAIADGDVLQVRAIAEQDPPDAAGLAELEAACEEQAETLHALEAGVLAQIRAAVMARLAAIRELGKELDADLSAGMLAPPAGFASLEQLEATAAALPEQEQGLRERLRTQVQRWLGRRPDLVSRLQAIAAEGLGVAERDTVQGVIRRLTGARQPGEAEVLAVEPIRRLGAGVRDADQQIARIDHENRLLDQRLAALQQRLLRFKEAFHDLNEYDIDALYERIWELTQPVPGVSLKRKARADQLEHAETLLDRLELHAVRLATAGFAEHWQRVANSDHEAVVELREQLRDPTFLPDVEQRKRLRALAEQKR